LSAVTTATPTPGAAHYAVRAIALARIGELEQARSAAAQYRSMAPAAPLGNTVDAYVALMSNDLAGAGIWLALAAPNDLLAKALRADLMFRTGSRTEGAALRQQVISSTLKLDGNPPLDFLKLIARMHAERLRPTT
jgi:Flp pilus assembly protein TadD